MNSRNYIFLATQLSIFLLGCKALDGERIIGGNVAPKKSYFYHVSIQRQGRHICGGGLIDENHIVTAAHCVADIDGNFFNKPLYIVGGTNHLKDSPTTKKGSYVKRVYTPDAYGRNYRKLKTNDIAVLEIFERFDFGPENFLKLPKEFDMHANANAIVTGFGCSKMELIKNSVLKGKLDGALRFSTVKILNRKECLTRKKVIEFSESRMCGQMNQRDPMIPEGVCNGDSGGPLVLGGNVIVGVVNNSSPKCTEENTPATYARVSYYIDFIKKCIADEIDSSIKSIKLPIF